MLYNDGGAFFGNENALPAGGSLKMRLAGVIFYPIKEIFHRYGGREMCGMFFGLLVIASFLTTVGNIIGKIKDLVAEKPDTEEDCGNIRRK